MHTVYLHGCKSVRLKPFGEDSHRIFFFKQAAELITKYWIKSQETEIIFITLFQIYWSTWDQPVC